MGGKARQGPKIAEFVMKVWKPGMGYYEPFCGALGAAHRVVRKMIDTGAEKPEIHLNDANESIINMWQAVFNGWMPPEVVTEATYNEIKGIRDPKDPMTAFCGAGMSFAGIWFAKYHGNGKGSARAGVAKRSILLKVSALRGASIHWGFSDYRQVEPKGAVMYLDPPYVGRTKAHAGGVDHDVFWQYAREMARDNTVLVTEFTAPGGWVRVHSWGDTVAWTGKSTGTNESIFVHESQLHLFRPNDSCPVTPDVVQ